MQSSARIFTALLFAGTVMAFGFHSGGASAGDDQAAELRLVDGRGVRHCHNAPRRVYCHTRDALPVTLQSNGIARA